MTIKKDHYEITMVSFDRKAFMENVNTSNRVSFSPLPPLSDMLQNDEKQSDFEQKSKKMLVCCSKFSC